MKKFTVIAYTVIFKEKCNVKMLPWQPFLSEFAEHYREGIVNV